MPTWPEYLDELEAWLARLGPALASGGPAAAPGATPPTLGRPDGPLPPGLAPRVLGVLASLGEMSVAGERRRIELLDARRRLQRRRGAPALGRGRLTADL